jgi:hypothetical protein
MICPNDLEVTVFMTRGESDELREISQFIAFLVAATARLLDL